MIRGWMLAIIFVAVGALVAFTFRTDTGYVLIQFQGYAIETSVLALIVIVLFTTPLMLTVLKAFWGMVQLPATVLKFAKRRREERARDSFESGMLKLLEGSWKRAEIELVRRASDHHAGHLNFLAAARAAQRLGSPKRRDHYLALASKDQPELSLAAEMTRGELQRERGEWALAKDTALKLRESHPKQPYPIELLAECHYALGEWTELHGLLCLTEKHGVPPPDRRNVLLQKALLERMKIARADARLDDLKLLWHQTPNHLRSDPELRRLYAHGLADLNLPAEASAIIDHALLTDWDGDLVQLYGRLHSKDPLGQLASIEQWLGRYGEKPELLITAGRACLTNKLWGKARSYLEAAIKIEPSPAAYLEMARLAEQTQNAEEAAQFNRKGLELAAKTD